MATISRIQAVWSGKAGLPGVSTFYALDAATALTALAGFYAESGGRIPNGITVSFAGTGDIINESNGEAVSTWTATPPAPLAGSASGMYAAPVGMAVTWVTGVFIGGRRVRGRTFMVPLASSVFEDNGTPTFAHHTAMAAAAQAAIDAVPGNLLVYHRETAPDANDGAGVAIVAALVSDKAAVLRSRRD